MKREDIERLLWDVETEDDGDGRTSSYLSTEARNRILSAFDALTAAKERQRLYIQRHVLAHFDLPIVCYGHQHDLCSEPACICECHFAPHDA